MKCPKCLTDNPDSSQYCGSCASPLLEEARLPDSPTKTLSTPVYVLVPKARNAEFLLSGEAKKG